MTQTRKKGAKKPQNKRQLFNSTKGFFVVKKEEKEFEFEGHFLHAKKWILIITIQYILSWFTNQAYEIRDLPKVDFKNQAEHINRSTKTSAQA